MLTAALLMTSSHSEGTPNFITTLGTVCKKLTKHLQSGPSWGALIRQLLATTCAICSGDYIPNKEAVLDTPLMQCLDSILTQGASTLAANHAVTCGKRMVFKFLHCLVESNAPYTVRIAEQIEDRLVLDELLNECHDLLVMSVFYSVKPSLNKADYVNTSKVGHRGRFFKNRQYQQQKPEILLRETAFDCWVVLDRFQHLTPWLPRGVDTTGTSSSLRKADTEKQTWHEMLRQIREHLRTCVTAKNAHVFQHGNDITSVRIRRGASHVGASQTGSLGRQMMDRAVDQTEKIAERHDANALFQWFREEFIDGDEDDDVDVVGNNVAEVRAKRFLQDFDCYGYFGTATRKIEVHLNGVNEQLRFMPKAEWEYGK